MKWDQRSKLTCSRWRIYFPVTGIEIHRSVLADDINIESPWLMTPDYEVWERKEGVSGMSLSAISLLGCRERLQSFTYRRPMTVLNHLIIGAHVNATFAWQSALSDATNDVVVPAVVIVVHSSLGRAQVRQSSRLGQKHVTAQRYVHIDVVWLLACHHTQLPQ